MAVDDVVPVAAHRADNGGGGGGATATAIAFPASSTACAICIAAASAYVVPTPLSYYATLAVSLACVARAAWPYRVEGALATAARWTASRARADLEADLRRLRPVRLAVAAVAGWRKKAVARWNELGHGDAARAATFVLRLVALVARLAATVLLDAARDEARAWAPSVLGYLRRVVDAIRSPLTPSCNKGGGDDEAAAAGLVLDDVVCLVVTGFSLLFTMHLLFISNAASRTQLCAVCAAAACGLTMLIVDWIDPPDDADDDETDDSCPECEGDAAGDGDGDGETGWDEELELEVRESWRFLWVLVLVTHCVDAFLLHVTLGPQPTTLAILALCNLEVLKAGRQVQLTPPDDDGKGAAAEVDGGGVINKWRRGAMVVYAASSAKILVVYLVLDCYMAALGFLWLCVMAELLLDEEDNLLDFDALGEEDDEEGEDVAGGAEEGEVDEEATRQEHSNASSSEDEEESSALCDDSSSEGEEESPAHCDGLEEEHETDGGSDGSTDDGWDLVDVDPAEMTAEANCGAKRRKSRLFPWKHVA